MFDEEMTYWALLKIAARLIAAALTRRIKEALTGRTR